MPIRANISTRLIYRWLSSHTRLYDSKCLEYHFAGCSEVKTSITVNIYNGIKDPAFVGASCLVVQVGPCTLLTYWFGLVLSQVRTCGVRTFHPQVTPALFTDCAKINNLFANGSHQPLTSHSLLFFMHTADVENTSIQDTPSTICRDLLVYRRDQLLLPMTCAAATRIAHSHPHRN